MKRHRLSLVTLGMAVALPLLGLSRAHGGLTITATFDSSITGDPNAAAIESTIDRAIQVYENTFTNNINVAIKFQEKSTGVGSNIYYYYQVSYANFLAALKADATSANDAIALAHLPNSTTNPVTNDPYIDVKTADLHALGFTGHDSGLSGGYDGIISLNTNVTDIGSPGTSGQYSLLASAEHEIDEVLGLGSTLPIPSNFFNDPLPEDLFRYDASGNRSFTASTTNAYFSINGTTDLARFNNSNDGGDYGDWQSNPRPSGVGPQVQDAFATPGARPTLGPNEITALDVIGYTVIPEPPSIVLTGMGGFFLLAYAWCRLAITLRSDRRPLDGA